MIDSLEAKIAAASQVKIMLESNAWKQYISPLLDRMIVDTIGGKEGDRWLDTPPALCERTIDSNEFRYLLGYKAALIEFHNNIYALIEEAEEAQKEQELQDSNDDTDMINSYYGEALNG